MPYPPGFESGFVLSLRNGEVWASWNDDRAPIPLGDYGAVLAVMHDFIQQSEIGERLMNMVRNERRA